MSLEASEIPHIEVQNVTVADYAQFIAQVAEAANVETIGADTVTLVHEQENIDPQQQNLQTIFVTHVIQQDGTSLGQNAALQITLPPPVQVIQPPVGKGPFTCEQCSKVFTRWNQLQRHRKVHDEEKPYKCDQCTASFNIQDNLRLHIATHVEIGDQPLCPECGKKFSRIASLKSHLMMHEKEESLMCPECGDEFALQSHLDRHYEEHRFESTDNTNKVYSCKQCTQDFNKVALLREHTKQHMKVRQSMARRSYKKNQDRTRFQHQCKICGKTFQKPSQVDRHTLIHTGEKPYICTICEKAFNQKGALQMHLKKHTGEKPWSCDFCPMVFAQKGNLRAHIKRVHTLPTGQEMVFQCDECSCVFRKLGSLNTHTSRVHSEPSEPPTQVRILSETTNDNQVTDVIQHLLELSEQPPAENSTEKGQTTSSGDGGGVVIITGDNVEPTSNIATETGDGDVTQASTDILQQAMESSGLADMAGVLSTNNQQRSLVFGSVSCISLHDATTGLIKKHIVRKVNGVRWHQCTYCSKEFKKPSDLVRHVRVHTQEKPYKCTQCYRSFAVKSTLTAHFKIHVGVKEYSCPTCNKMFSTVGSLKVHQRLHTASVFTNEEMMTAANLPQGAKPFGCTYCEKKFRTSAHRKCHLMSHFKSDSDPTKSRKAARRHSKSDIPLPDIPLQEPILITENGFIQQAPRSSMLTDYYIEGSLDRPYKCTYCDHGFKKSSHLKQHIRSHTGEKPYKCLQCHRCFVSNGALKAHIRTHTDVRSYRCIVCTSTFTTNGSLKRHMSTHTEMRPFMCPYCQKTFKTSVNCKKHMKTHRHELAMQALQQQGHQLDVTVTEDGETIDTAVHHAASVELIEVEEDEDASALAVAGLAQADHLPQDITSSAVLTDPLNETHLDQQLQNTLTQQVFPGTSLIPQTLQVVPQSLNQTLHIPSQPISQSLHLLPQTLSQITSQFVPTNSAPFQSTIDLNTLNTQLSQALAVQVSQADTTTVSTVMSNNDSVQNILTASEPQLDVIQQTQLATESIDTVTTEVDADEEARNHACCYCAKSFKKSSHLKQHIRSHTGERPFKCIICHHSFVSSGVLKAHLRTHSNKRSFRCHLCSTSFTTNGSLTRHMVVHNGIHPFKCPHCEQTFRSISLCKKHIKLHPSPGDLLGTSDESRRSRAAATTVELSQEQAVQLSAHPDDLSLSEKVLVESTLEKNSISEVRDLHVDEQPFHANQCSHCPKSFKKPSDLQRHLRIHSGERPFNCSECGRSFTVKSTLESHMKTHRKGDKKFKCHVCCSLFSTKGSLKVHMRLHTGARPFRCPHCDQRFRTSGHRKSHILLHFKDDSGTKKRRFIGRGGADAITLLQNAAAKAEHYQHEQQQHEQQQITLETIDQQQPQQQQIQIQLAPDQQHALLSAVQAQQAGIQLPSQVVNLDQSVLQGQASYMPITIPVDGLGQVNVAQDNSGVGVPAQAIQQLDSGIQLQFTGNLGQGIQITNIDLGMLNQTLQIDASLLQQLQQGNVNITINNNLMNVPVAGGTVTNQNIQTLDPASMLQNVQLQPVSLMETVNPNLVIQQASVPQTVMPQQMPLNLAPQQVLQGGTVISTGQESSPASFIVTTQNPNEQVSLSSDHGGNLAQESVLILDGSDGGGMQAVLQSAVAAAQADNQQAIDVVDDGLDDDDDILDNEDDQDAEDVGKGVCVDDALSFVQMECDEGTPLIDEDDISSMLGQAETIGDPSRPHVCQPCRKAYKRASHLQEHLVSPAHRIGTKRAAKSLDHMCDQCNKSFQKPSLLERHKRIHTGERPYVCDVCQKAFNQKNALHVHQQQHRGERPYQCPYCTQQLIVKTFTQKGNLKAHIKRAHHIEMVMAMKLPLGVIVDVPSRPHDLTGIDSGPEDALVDDEDDRLVTVVEDTGEQIIPQDEVGPGTNDHTVVQDGIEMLQLFSLGANSQ